MVASSTVIHQNQKSSSNEQLRLILKNFALPVYVNKLVNSGVNETLKPLG